MQSSYLLLNPEALLHRSYLDIFRVVHRTRLKDKTGFNFDSRIAPNLRALYTGSNQHIIDTIRALDAPRIETEIAALGRIHAKQKSGISYEAYMERATPRMIHELCKGLRDIASQFTLYHRFKRPDNGNYTVAACTISNSPVRLLFSIYKSPTGALTVLPQVEIAGEVKDLSGFVVSGFMIQLDSVYYLLSIKDMQTLDWLTKAEPSQYQHDPAALADQIVSVLERDYEVVKEAVFQVNIVDCAPVHAVYLSEISDTYLMFTPRWDYEGLVIESIDQPDTEEIRQGEIYRVVRQREVELAFVEMLRGLHPSFERQRNGHFYLSFDDAKKKNWFLKIYQQLLADQVQIVGMDMLRHFRYSPHPIHTEMTISRTIDTTMHLNMRISFGEEQIDLSVIQRTVLTGQRFVLLRDHSIGVITDEWYDQYGAICKHGKISQGELIVPTWILLSIDEPHRSSALRPAIARDWWLDWQRWQTDTEPMIPCPAGLQASLRPYQHKGFEWLVLLSQIGAGACLADDMGLGKTLQTLAFMTHTYAQKPTARYLIVAPLSLVFNWEQEMRKFAPDMATYVFHQQQRSISDFITSGVPVMITSYGTLRSAIDDLCLVSWHTVVIDESHNIKNPTAQITKAIYRLSASNRIALSGTPVMNNTFDIFSQLNFLLPTLLGGAEFFKREYAIPIDRDMNMEKAAALQRITAPFVLRRTKKQVAADLPDKTETILWCEMGEEQMDAYLTIKKQIKANVFLDIQQVGWSKAKFSILQGIMKLRQLCCAPSLLRDEEITTTQSIKLDMLLDELRSTASSGKSLVFSQYLGMLEMVATQCRAEGIPYLYFDGSTPLAQRAEMVNTFQREDSIERVFLISLKAGNAGLNLTAAEYVFLIDPWWNNAVEQQAIDRTHRIGQTKHIFAYKLICRNTIEEKIIALQQRKKQLSEELVTEEEGFVKQLSEDDIAFLFE
jgi:superfamily II DNA or RNA helicase